MIFLLNRKGAKKKWAENSINKGENSCSHSDTSSYRVDTFA